MVQVAGEVGVASCGCLGFLHGQGPFLIQMDRQNHLIILLLLMEVINVKVFPSESAYSGCRAGVLHWVSQLEE